MSSIGGSKYYRLVASLLLISTLLSSCQSTPRAQVECDKAGAGDNCDRATVSSKTPYPNQFVVDPHGRHQLKVQRAIVAEKGREQIATFSVKHAEHKYRQYAHSIIAPSQHAPRAIRYQEDPGYPRVRSGNLPFDALFALALDEMRSSYIGRTSDADYQKGKSFACDCFGDKNSAHFIDLPTLALAGYSALAGLSSERMKNSLLFNLSPYRQGIKKPAAVPGGERGWQIVQRAGKFGSWPLYADRAMWSLAAEKTLYSLAGKTQREFASRAYRALKNTLEIDRTTIFDGREGLYFSSHTLYGKKPLARGVDFLQSKSLVVNLFYYQSLKFASNLANDQRDVVSSIKYMDWAVDLKNAIKHYFWVAEDGLYRLQHPSEFVLDTGPKFEWWAQVLAVDLGVVSAPELKSIMGYQARDTDMASPLQMGIGLRAAVKSKNASMADLVYRRLIDNPTVYLSNSNRDFSVPQGLTGTAAAGDLVSVSTYLAMVVDSVFGLKPSASGLSFRPFISSGLRRDQFKNSRSISLYDIRLQEKTFDIKILLPPSSDKNGHYTIRSMTLNGKSFQGEIPWAEFNDSNTVIVTLGKLIPAHTPTRSFPATRRHTAETKRSQLSATSIEITVTDSRVKTLTGAARVKGSYLPNWGGVEAKLRVEGIELQAPARYAIQLKYRNRAATLGGLSNAVKWLVVKDENGNERAAKAIQMPQTEGAGWEYSSALILLLNPGSYSITIEDFLNMSYLKANMTYTGKGGVRGASNRIDIKAIRFSPILDGR